jgi:hypothetical protein
MNTKRLKEESPGLGIWNEADEEKQTREKWDKLRKWVVTEGAEKLIDILQTSEGEKYVRHYSIILEYFKPKLSKTDSSTDLTKGLVINFKSATTKEVLKKVADDN